MGHQFYIITFFRVISQYFRYTVHGCCYGLLYVIVIIFLTLFLLSFNTSATMLYPAVIFALSFLKTKKFD